MQIFYTNVQISQSITIQNDTNVNFPKTSDFYNDFMMLEKILINKYYFHNENGLL